MPTLKLGEAEIYYEEYGSGYPVLAFAPGSLRSQVLFWRRSPSNPANLAPWLDATTDLARDFRVIAMDIRNAGRSRGPLGPDDAWQPYGEDHVALLDHLKIESCHTIGGCIGATFCLMLAEMAPGRVKSAVLFQPIGRTAENEKLMVQEYAEMWAPAIRKTNSDLKESVIKGFGDRLFKRDFVYGSSRDFVASCNIPMLIMPGNDLPHPAVIAEDLMRLAPRAELLKAWKGEYKAYSALCARDFFSRNTPR